MLRPCVTLTGLDESTDLDRVCRLLRDRPYVEVGILVTANPEGRRRYPSGPWITNALRQLPEHRVALHVCGGMARRWLFDGFLADYWLHRFAIDRVQVNGCLSWLDVEDLCRLHPRTEIITQHTETNVALLGVGAPRHALLVDGSGGRGVLPAVWASPSTTKPVGFAGGLGHETLAAALPAILPLCRPGAWILRDEADRFDLDRAEAALAAFDAATADLSQSRNAPR